MLQKVSAMSASKIQQQASLIVIAILLSLCHFSAAALNLTAQTAKLALVAQFDILEDPAAALSIEDIQRPEISARFRPLQGNLKAGYTHSAYWLRLPLARIDASTPQQWWLEISPSMLDDIRLYQSRPDGQFELQQAGDHLAFSQQAMHYRNPLFHLTLNQGDTFVLLRVASTSSLFVQATLWSPQGFAEESNQVSVMLGMFYGVMLAMIAYNFFLLLSFQDKAMLYYLLLSSAVLLAALSANGHIAQFFVPDWPALVDLLPGLTVPLILLTMSLFIASFLQLKQKIPKMYQVFRLVQLFAVLAIAMVLAGQNHRIAPYVQIIGFLQILLILPVCVLSGMRGYRPGYIAAIASTGWIFGASLVVLRNIGLIPPSWATTYGFQIGNVLEVILLALALAERINILKKERELAQAQLLRLSQNAGQELEAQVKLRTAELGQAVDSLQQLNNEKNEFLGIAAHDLKNPLTAIIGMSELLRHAELPISEQQRSHYLERIGKNGQRMMHIITNLLDVNALECGQMHFASELVDLNQKLSDMALQYELSASAKGLRLQLTPGETVLVMADGAALSQVLDNLISNAVKYSPHGKIIWLNAGTEPGFGYCRIRDEGDGLSEADQQHLFERFTRLSSVPTGGEHSSGLGLSIVKKLSVAMHGSITCDSAPGQGCIFTVRFPLAKSS